MALHDTVPVAASASAKAPSGLFAAAGMSIGLGAVLASSCCALPLLLEGLGAGAGAFAALETLASLRLPLIALAGLAVAGGWILWWRKLSASCEAACAPARRPMIATLVLGIATLLVIMAIAWDFIEPALLRFTRTT
ncbi:mercuric ion transport protein [Rhizobiales bacterium GAS188]|nr:mercuric ion transport protein [Rhizobiales bacterium GAS188]